MVLIWSEEAIADLVRIRTYIAEHNPSAASQLAVRLLAVSELLISNVHIGVATRRAGVRRATKTAADGYPPLVVPPRMATLQQALPGSIHAENCRRRGGRR
ncbi:type II toxin-antitoxin system RelE/ParE family toxin [Neorhizobium alkalisoli]|uniref:type II toxin-antitoxin system RelE/ParE family toxin n=1 Tax=Neorhizobium alkalisoli TaxID=528178 RepID=UPI0011A4031F